MALFGNFWRYLAILWLENLISILFNEPHIFPIHKDHKVLVLLYNFQMKISKIVHCGASIKSQSHFGFRLSTFVTNSDFCQELDIRSSVWKLKITTKGIIVAKKTNCYWQRWRGKPMEGGIKSIIDLDVGFCGSAKLSHFFLVD